MIVVGDKVVAFGFHRAAANSRILTRTCTVRAGRKTLAAVLSRAPRRTGQYSSTIKLKVTFTFRGASAEVYSEHPAAWRLEKGFHGVDSKGRHYHEAGRPHFAPAAKAGGSELYRELEVMVLKL